MRNRIAIVDIAIQQFKALSYKQYDVNNVLQVVVMENKKVVDITSYMATVYFELPSGKTYRTVGTIENNTINIILSSSVLKEDGKVILEVELSNGSEIVTTFSIYLNVEKSIDGNESSDVEDDPSLIDIHHTHENKEVLDKITQEMLDNITIGGNIDLSNYVTKDELNEKIANIDLSALATTEYVDNQINTHNHPTIENKNIDTIIDDIF